MAKKKDRDLDNSWIIEVKYDAAAKGMAHDLNDEVRNALHYREEWVLSGWNYDNSIYDRHDLEWCIDKFPKIYKSQIFREGETEWRIRNLITNQIIPNDLLNG